VSPETTHGAVDGQGEPVLVGRATVGVVLADVLDELAGAAEVAVLCALDGGALVEAPAGVEPSASPTGLLGPPDVPSTKTITATISTASSTRMVRPHAARRRSACSSSAEEKTSLTGIPSR